MKGKGGGKGVRMQGGRASVVGRGLSRMTGGEWIE